MLRMPGFFARLHRLRPSRPRHPLLRVAFALLGLVLLLLLLAGGIFIGLGMLAFSAVRRLRGRAASPRATSSRAAAGSVLDGEYRVVQPRAVTQGR